VFLLHKIYHYVIHEHQMSLITCLQDCYFSSFTLHVIFTLITLFINKQYIILCINIKYYDCEIHLNLTYMYKVYKSSCIILYHL